MTPTQQRKIIAFSKAARDATNAGVLAFAEAARVNTLLQGLVLNPGQEFDRADLSLDVDGVNTLSARANTRIDEMNAAFKAMLDALKGQP